MHRWLGMGGKRRRRDEKEGQQHRERERERSVVLAAICALAKRGKSVRGRPDPPFMQVQSHRCRVHVRGSYVSMGAKRTPAKGHRTRNTCMYPFVVVVVGLIALIDGGRQKRQLWKQEPPILQFISPLRSLLLRCQRIKFPPYILGRRTHTHIITRPAQKRLLGDRRTNERTNGRCIAIARRATPRQEGEESG